jgi:hypothetical protein
VRFDVEGVRFDVASGAIWAPAFRSLLVRDQHKWAPVKRQITH